MELAPLPKDADDAFVPDLTEGAEAGLYLSLFELMNEGLIVASDEVILEVNSAACRLMERSYRDLAGKPLATLFASERAFLSARATLFIQGEMRGSLRVMLPGGRERDLAYVAAARIRPGVHALILSADPVTGHSPQNARAADTVWPRLAAALDQPALVIDARDHIVAANGAARRRFGATESALTGYPLSTLCTLSDPAQDNGPVSIHPVDGSPALHGRVIAGPEPGWRIVLLAGAAPLVPVDGRTKEVFRHAAFPMLVVRASDGRVVAANDIAANTYGMSHAHLLNSTLDDIRRPVEGRPAFEGGVWQWRGAAGEFAATAIVRALDGARTEWLVTHDAPNAPWPAAQAKRTGGPPVTQTLRQRHTEGDASQAHIHQSCAAPVRPIDLNMLAMHFQPVRDACTGGLVAAEALLRYRHPDFGLLGPRDFMDIALDSDENVNIGWHALALACQHAAEWHRAGVAIPVAISVTAPMLMRHKPLERLGATLLDSGLPASAIELNLPEDCLREGNERFDTTLRAIDRLGIRLAATGIGVQALPIGRLHRLPISTFKLDRSLIRDLGRNGDATVLGATISVVRALSRSVQAVGIETDAQAKTLLEMGCERQQGRLYAAPLPTDEFAQLL